MNKGRNVNIKAGLERRIPGTISFADPNQIHKKAVRGLLRKRAKQYDSDNSDEEN